MEKVIYLVQHAHGIESRLVSRSPALREHTSGLTVTTCDSASESQGPAAILSAWFACIDRRDAFEAALSDLDAGFAAYLVTESVLRRQARHVVAQADKTPVTLLFLHQAPGLGQAELRASLAALTPALRELKDDVAITRDTIARPLHSAAPPLRAVFGFVHSHIPVEVLTTALADLKADWLWSTLHASVRGASRQGLLA